MNKVKQGNIRKSLYKEISLKVSDIPGKQTMSAAQIRDLLVEKIAETMLVEPDQIDDQEEFTRYISSLEAMELLGELEKKLDRRLTPAIVTHYPNIAMLARHLGGEDNTQQEYQQSELELRVG